MNEMLQEQFNESVFTSERRLLQAEGVEVDDGALASSATRLGLMTRLLIGLDDQCRLGDRGSDSEFCQQIATVHKERGVCQPETLGKFSIFHYAGKVTYTTDGFIAKNSDAMHPDMQQCMASCEALDPIVVLLVPPSGENDGEESPRDKRASLIASAGSSSESVGGGSGMGSSGNVFGVKLKGSGGRKMSLHEVEASDTPTPDEPTTPTGEKKKKNVFSLFGRKKSAETVKDAPPPPQDETSPPPPPDEPSPEPPPPDGPPDGLPPPPAEPVETAAKRLNLVAPQTLAILMPPPEEEPPSPRGGRRSVVARKNKKGGAMTLGAPACRKGGLERRQAHRADGAAASDIGALHSLRQAQRQHGGLRLRAAARARPAAVLGHPRDGSHPPAGLPVTHAVS